MMTRKGYELIAAVLKAQMPAEVDINYPWYRTVLAFSKRLKEENVRFNEDRFMRACGLIKRG